MTLTLAARCLVAVGAALITPGVWADGDLTQSKPGDILSGIVTLGHNQVVLPGEFEVIAVNPYPSEGHKLMEAFLLQKDSSGKYKAHVRINGSLEFSRNEGWSNNECVRDHYHHKEWTNTSPYRMECAFVNHITRFMVTPSDKSPLQWPLYLHAREKKMKIPSTFVASIFIRFIPSKFVKVEYGFAPETGGVADENPVAWQLSEWHRDVAKNDPARKRFLETVNQWTSQVMQPSNRALFDGELLTTNMAMPALLP